MHEVDIEHSSGEEGGSPVLDGGRLRLQPASALRHAIDEWQKRLAEFQRSNPNPIALASAAESRRIYRLRREAEGKTVRPYNYHDHEPWKFGETHESRERRLHRDRARAKRGVDETSVRSWTDLSSMSDEEKAVHRRRLAAERKARERERARLSLSANGANADGSSETVGGDVDWNMF
ncbi:hypothetical protein [Rhizobium sp. YTU87027]|uniref:hypothetical protein n=1 Tax=Rhizobium sp. YTU87027 TaxID=3417741 RepID=UPI003D681EDA